MSSMNRIAFALVSLLTTANLAMAAEPTTKPAKPKLTPGGEASCLVKITCDPTVLPLTPEVVEALLKSSPVVRSALRSVYDEEGVDVLDVSFAPMGGTVSGGQMGAGAGGYGGGGMGGGGGLSGGPYGAGRSGLATGPRAPGLGGPVAPGGMGAMMGSTGVAAGSFSTISLDDSAIQSEVTLLGAVHLAVSTDIGANEVLMAVCERLRNALTELHRTELGRAEDTVILANKEVELAERKLRELQETRRALLDKAGQVDLSRDAVVEMTRRLETEKQDVFLKLESAKMRKNALERQIAELGDKVKALTAKPEHPSVTAARAKLDSLRQKVDHIKQLVASGQAPTSEANQATAELAGAQAELEAKTQELIAAQGGNRVTKLNDELGELSIQTTEWMGRLDMLEKRLQETRPLLNATDSYEVSIVVEWPLARQSYERARVFQESVERRMRTIRPPAVTVIGEK